MQSFNSHPDVSDGDFKISSCQSFCFSGSLLPDDPAVSGYILLKKVSLHYFQNLCTRFVTSVQYEKPLLSSPEVLLFLSFVWNDSHLNGCTRSFLQETQLLSLHIEDVFPSVLNGLTSFFVMNLYYHFSLYLSIHFSKKILIFCCIFCIKFLYSSNCL